jgi:hypothetical protein
MKSRIDDHECTKKKMNCVITMNSNEEDGRFTSILLVNKSNKSVNNEEELFVGYFLLIIFETVRISSSIFSVLGVLGNIALIYVICNTSFRHVSYGLLIIIIAFFDSIRLLSSIFYYLLFSNVIPINSLTETIYVFIDRYPIFIVNWCKVRINISNKNKKVFSKVLMSIERFLTVRYWERHTHLDWRSKHKRKQHRHFTYSIIFILVSGLISQHPNFVLRRYQTVYINYKSLMLIKIQDKTFYYGYYHFNGAIFTIMSYLILDTTMPVLSVLFVNILLLREIKKLPLSLQVKVKESIGILFFLTALSIAILPRAFIAFYSYYKLNQNLAFIKKLIIIFYICLGKFYFYLFFFKFLFCKGFEYFNHAITGYACFLSSALLRSELKNMIWTRYIAPNLH